MTNTKIQEKYNTNGRVYQLKLFSDMDVMIAEDDPVRLLDAVLEGLDYAALYRAYSLQERKTNTSPVTMFKVIVYGMSERIYSKRQIAKKCLRDVILITHKKRAKICKDIFCLPRQTTQTGFVPGKEDNEGRRKIDRKDSTFFYG